VTADSARLVGAPVESTRFPLELSHTVDGFAVGGNAVEKSGGCTPMIAAASGARSELCCDTSCVPARSLQSTTTAKRLPVWPTSPHATYRLTKNGVPDRVQV
jgi:hypothetical protein